MLDLIPCWKSSVFFYYCTAVVGCMIHVVVEGYCLKRNGKLANKASSFIELCTCIALQPYNRRKNCSALSMQQTVMRTHHMGWRVWGSNLGFRVSLSIYFSFCASFAASLHGVPGPFFCPATTGLGNQAYRVIIIRLIITQNSPTQTIANDATNHAWLSTFSVPSAVC